jgi:predicted GNAT family acetyltransferase
MSDGVRHNEDDHQFELPVDGGLAFVTYHRHGDRITFIHTEVPQQAEGKGVAAKVVSAALDFARRQKLQVIAECAYVASYLRKHPQ